MLNKIKKTLKEPPEGQFCPDCDDTYLNLGGIATPAWIKCPACGGEFYAEESDSDYEDYHLRRKSNAPKPSKIPVATVWHRPRGQ